MKALKTLAATAAIGALLATPAMADVSTSIYYNGELLNTTQPVVNVDGRVLLAFRDLFENLEGDVTWSDEFRMASVTHGKNTINLFPDTGAVQINGVPQSLAVGPQIINDRVYLPLRFVAQSLGGTVDYSKGEGDTGIIRINTIDSVENFAQKEGNVTKILRTTSAPTNTIQVTEENKSAYQAWKNNNSSYFVDDHGNLIEVQSYDQKIQVNVIDLNNAKVDSKTYDTNILFPALTSVSRDGQTYTIGINEKASTRYAGVGTPNGSNYDEVLETEQGDLSLYHGSSNTNVFRFDASADTGTVTSDRETGKVLDLSQRLADAEQNSYAVAANGNYGFLMDGHLLIIDSQNEIKEDIVLTRSAEDSRIFAIGNEFVVIAVEGDLRYPEVYAAVYHADGSVNYGFHNISHISKVADGETFYEYNNLKIEDMVQQNQKIYMLVKTDMDYYIVIYDANTNKSTVEMLSIKEKNYEGFIYTMDDVKLFAADDDYYYLRDVD